MSARILVIEDNPASRELAAYLLGKSGHTVEVAENGAQGLRMAAESRPDLILCDLQMPELNGYEFIAEVRKHGELGAALVLAVTALSMPGDEAKALNAGFNGYLSKPIDPMRFCAQIEAYLPEQLRRGA